MARVSDLLAMHPEELLSKSALNQRLQQYRKVLIIIDQYEELYTLATRQELGKFEQVVSALLGASAALRHVHVILSLRIEFYNLFAASAVGRHVHQRLTLRPLRDEALAEAIAEPAGAAGTVLQPEVLKQILIDVGKEPGVMPFLQKFLVMLWQRRSGREIRISEYRRLLEELDSKTTFQAILAKDAEAAYAALADDQERIVAMRIFLRLVQFTGSRHQGRRRQLLLDLLREGMEDEAVFRRVLSRLIDCGLVTTAFHRPHTPAPAAGKIADGKPAAELAHETLIWGWFRLREWIRQWERRENTRRRLEIRAEKWKRQGGGKQSLLTAQELAQLEGWPNDPEVAVLGLSANLLRYLAESIRNLRPPS
jgi:hypothetical protein